MNNFTTNLMLYMQTRTALLTDAMVKALDKHKALDIVTMDFTRIENSICRTFIICSGTSTTHTASLADNAEWEVREETGERPLHTEGGGQSGWVVMDYGDVVVHIFLEEERKRFRLEDLWADAGISRPGSVDE